MIQIWKKIWSGVSLAKVLYEKLLHWKTALQVSWTSWMYECGIHSSCSKGFFSYIFSFCWCCVSRAVRNPAERSGSKVNGPARHCAGSWRRGWKSQWVRQCPQAILGIFVEIFLSTVTAKQCNTRGNKATRAVNSRTRPGRCALFLFAATRFLFAATSLFAATIFYFPEAIPEPKLTLTQTLDLFQGRVGTWPAT